MSGLEVVGVVLGALPLLLAGLEQYMTGLRAASHMVNYEKTVEHLILDFRVYSSLYSHTSDRLIRPLMLHPSEWDELRKDPYGPGWRAPELTAALQRWLGAGDYNTYIDVATRLNTKLNKFALNLALDPDNSMKPKWLADEAVPKGSQPSFRHRFLRRSNKTWEGLKIGVRSGDLQRHLDSVRRDLDSLANLLDANERAAPERQAHQRRIKTTVWQTVRAAARSMYDSLAQHWQCPEDHKHAAVLRLEGRETHETTALVKFGIIGMWLEQRAASQLQQWHEIEVASKPSLTTSTVIPPKPAGRVRFADPNTKSTTSTSLPPTTSTRKIDSLCEWQHKCVSKTVSPPDAGFLEDQAWHHHVEDVHDSADLCSDPSLLCLRDCIGAGGLPSTPPTSIKGGGSISLTPSSSMSSSVASLIFPRGLSTKEKYQVAAILASTVRQLSETPWLPTHHFSLAKIYLMERQQRRRTAAHPYLHCHFQTPTTANPQPLATQKTSLIDNALVFALGVILIELAFGEPLANFKQAGDKDIQGNDLPHAELQIACRVLKKLPDLEGGEYAKVAHWCIRGNASLTNHSLDDPEFQDHFYVNVIEPLVALKKSLDGR